MSKIIVIGDGGSNANVMMQLLNENFSAMQGPATVALGSMMFKTAEKTGPAMLKDMAGHPLGKFALASLAIFGASVSNNPKASFMASAMLNNAVEDCAKLLDGNLDKAMKEFMGKATKPAQGTNAEVSMAAAEAFQALNADGDKSTRFSTTIGESEGKAAPTKADTKPEAESDYWPTNQKELKVVPQGQPNAGRFYCPLCDKAHKHKTFRLVKADPNRPEVLICTECTNELRNKAAAAEAVKEGEARYHEAKVEITTIEAELTDAEREAKNIEKMAGDKPSAIMAAAVAGANAAVDELNVRLMALYDETAGYELKAGLTTPKDKPASKTANPGGKPGVLGKLADAGKK